MKQMRLELEGLTFDVGLAHTRLKHGGGWSYFICPCGRLARTLRLLEGRLVCSRCDGLLYRCQLGDRPGQRQGDKSPAIARRLERVYGPPARLKTGQSKPATERLETLERRLRRALIVERERRLKGWKG